MKYDKHLTPSQYEMIRRMRIEGQSYNRIAERLGMARQTMQSRLRNGVAKITAPPIEPTYTRLPSKVGRNRFSACGIVWRDWSGKAREKWPRENWCKACGDWQAIWSEEEDRQCFCCWQKAMAAARAARNRVKAGQRAQ